MSDTIDLFLITGATDKAGPATVELLRQHGFRVRALLYTLSVAWGHQTDALGK